MDKASAAQTILEKALPNVAFDGWTPQLLTRAARDAGYDESIIYRVFPGGVLDALDLFSLTTDRAMAQTLSTLPLSSMKLRERIAAAIRARLDHLLPHREAARRAFSFYLLPHHAMAGMKVLYRTVDEMWFAAGDTSTDFNFYTKRLTLAGVYSTTLRFWLDDESEGQKDTWEFLNRRIENVMQFERAKHKAKSFFKPPF